MWFRDPAPPCVLRTVIVNLADDPATALRGVLWEYRRGWIVLREVVALKAGAAPAPIDGEVVIHRDRVLFFQAP